MAFLANLKLLTRGVLLKNSSDRGIKRWVAPTLRELERRRKRMGPQPPSPRSSYLEWNRDAELFSFGKRLGEDFDPDLLNRAFTHRSYVAQQEVTGFEDNTELVAEGDSLILKSIRDRFANYPGPILEALTKHLTDDKMLAHVAFHMGTKDIILSADFPVEEATLANTFRAIVAALGRSTDETKADVFVADFLLCQLNGGDVYEIWNPENPYEVLKRLASERGVKEIEPRLCNQSATNTILANYQVGLYDHNKNLLGIGWGESIEVAKETAALSAIKKLYNISN